MTSRSSRGRWQRVIEARQQARKALGCDPNGRELYDAPPKRKPQLAPPPAVKLLPARHPSERVEYVLTLGEAAASLGVNRGELEAMIDAGKIEALPTGFTRTIPSREVARSSKSTC
jgi:excisionase family DNA binding protein